MTLFKEVKYLKLLVKLAKEKFNILDFTKYRKCPKMIEMFGIIR